MLYARSNLHLKLAFYLILLFSTNTTLAQNNDDYLLGDAESVSIATGRKQPIRTAPAVTYVITKEDIEGVSATTLGEMLELVPGAHTLFQFQGDHYIFRGIRSIGNFNPDVLIMIDGISQNDFHLANQRRYISQIPLQNIKRVEVIIGPYSVLYGADAFAGVVNIITTRGSDIEHSSLSVRSGSFGTNEFRWLHNFSPNALISVQLRDTDGHEPLIQEDAQTAFDQLFGTSASLAPGPAATNYKDYNLMFDYTLDKWLIRFRTRGHEVGMGAGIVSALDYDGIAKSTQYNVEAHYSNTDFSDWNVDAKFSYFNYTLETENVHAFPRGAFGGVFPDGVIDNPGYSERHYRVESSAFYKRVDKHFSRLGTGVEYAQVYDVNETRNYIADPITGIPIAPLPEVVEVGEDQLYSKDEDRTLAYLYIQDEWFVAPDWTVTSGIRYDYYSDFGGTVNPRVAVVWATTSKLTSKFLIGRGVRVPTFLELNGTTNPSNLGNPDLDPVTITSTELSFNYLPDHKSSFGLTFFYHDIEDDIALESQPIGTQAKNGADQMGYGYELSGQWKASSTFSLIGYYANQSNEISDTNQNRGVGPRDKIKIRGDWQFLPEWRINAIFTRVSDMRRESDDPRPSVDDYSIVDVNFIYNPNSNWKFSLKINNLFDENATAPGDTGGIDISLPERSIFGTIELSY